MNAHLISRRLLLVLPAAALMATACGPGPGQGATCSESMLPGDLVISEIMANPDGTDDGNEWFEIYDAAGAPLDLTGLRLVASRADGSGEKSIALAKDTGIVTDQYLVLGDTVPDAKPAWIDYAYGSALGSLRNSDGRIALVCGNTTIDEVTYASTSDGHSLELTGALAPDAMANDSEENWCKTEEGEYSPGNFGSPQAANAICQGGPSATTCDDGGTVRDLVSPVAGDLVISEIMPNPSAVNDSDGEWFEVAVLRDVDLNGLAIGQTPGGSVSTLDDTACLRARAGSYLVFARSADPAVNGGLPQVTGTFTAGLTNSNGTLFIGHGDAVLDQVAWTSSPNGASIALDPAQTSPAGNDDAENWCEGDTPYGPGGTGDLGTPGSPNAACPAVVPDGYCMDGGTARPTVPPAAGDLRLNEVMADPDAASDTSGEWFEVRVDRDVDLNGLELSSGGSVRQTLTSGDCLRVTAGTYLVFARSDVPADNGGLPKVDQTISFSLTNSGGSVGLGVAGTALDTYSWSSATTGRSDSREETSDTWCLAADTDTYGAGDLGTPGASNGTPVCQ